MKFNNAPKYLMMTALILMISLTAAAQGRSRVLGKVVDAQGNPVVGAVINLVRTKAAAGTSEATLTSDDTGTFVTTLIGGSWDTEVNHPDYMVYTSRIKVSYNQRTPDIEFVLQKRIVAPEDKAREVTKEAISAGQTLVDDGKYDEAVAVFSDYLVQNPEMYLVNVYIADAYSKKGDDETAIAFYNKVLESEENNLISLKAIGDIHVKSFDYAAGLTYYKKLTELDPDNVDHLHTAGELANGVNDYDLAIEYFTRFIELEPRTGRTFTAALTVGFVYSTRNDCENLEKYFDIALSLDTSMEADLKAEIKRCQDSK